jgi:protein tyrosine/serine phosphatase
LIDICKSARLRMTLCIVMGIAVLASATVVTLNHWKRPHAVIEGEAYRSAQLSTPDLAAFARSADLKSVLSLRSRNTTDERHQQEIEWCARNGLVHRQVPLTPTQIPSPAQLKTLIHELATMPKPILIHCEKGADRTGLASAI